MRYYTLLLFLLGAPISLKAQVAISTATSTYTANFNALPSSGTSNTWTNNTTLTGWYAAQYTDANADGTPEQVTPSVIAANNGSSTSARLFSYGVAGVNANAERALGSRGSNTGGDFAWGLRMVNQSGDTIKSVTISFRGEQWSINKSNNYQFITFGYCVGSFSDFTTIDTAFVQVPELYFGSLIRSSTDSMALDGNATGNFVTLQARFNVRILPNETIVFKWVDANDAKFDYAMAIDDFSAAFADTAVAYDTFSGPVSIYKYFCGVIPKIPEHGESYPAKYLLPSSSDLSTWQMALINAVSGGYQDAYNMCNSMGYNLVLYTNTTNGKNYCILRKHGASQYFWGTYVLAVGATIECLNIQSPHPIYDSYSGVQGAYIFENTGAYSFSISGIDRCFSPNYSICEGKTAVCSTDTTQTKFRESDNAHQLNTFFDTYTRFIADQIATSKFIQLHGFVKGSSDPHFIISNGTYKLTTPDYAKMIGDSIVANTSLSYKTPHLDNYKVKLMGTDNVQGRYLNTYYSLNTICEGTKTDSTPTGRFLHIEQYYDYRAYEENYPLMTKFIANSYTNNCAAPLMQWFLFAGVEVQSNAVVLRWAVAREAVAKHFIVQRSTDGLHFTTIAQTPAQTGSTYSYTDFTYEAPAYYRIGLVQAEHTVWSDILANAAPLGKDTWQISPNPATDYLMVSGSELSSAAVYMHTTAGLQVNDWQVASTNSGLLLDVSRLPAGVYVLTVVGSSGKQSKLFFKQ